jgi:hypothetical protein
MALVLGCGSRSDIDLPLQGAGGNTATGTSVTSASSTGATSSSSTTAVTSTTSTSTGGGCLSDADCDDGVGCTVDFCAGGECTAAPSDALCDDGVACTKDSCDVFADCAHAPLDALCTDGVGCTADFCLPGVGCSYEPCDDVCSDGSFCNGLERCDPASGCVKAPPPCDDGIVCSIDTCSPGGSGACGHTVSAGCVVPQSTALVVGAGGELVLVNIALGTTLSQLPGGGIYLDVARIGARLFACDGGAIYELDPASGLVLGTVAQSSANSLGGASDGFLYSADTFLYRISADTGSIETLAALPYGHVSSGDVAILGGHAFVTTTSACGFDSLVDVDLATGASFSVGKIPTPCVYGLIAVNGELFGFSCEGHIARVDPTTADSVIIATASPKAYGATGDEG